MRGNNQNESYPTYYSRPDVNAAGPSPATWGQRDRQDVPFDGTVSSNGRNGQTTAVPPFDWHASEALMRCYNG